MANEYNAERTLAETTIDFLIGGHTDSNIATYITAQKQNFADGQLLGALITQMLDRIETLEAP